MSENIAGYIDRGYIKGQYYRYAANPIPMVFTGNIDEISDADLLARGMLVTRGNVSGTLPNDFGSSFLITTVKYGNDTYLQTAYLVQSGYDCWEYRRIYAGGWTKWVGVDSAINSTVDSIAEAQSTADSANKKANEINTEISKITTSIDNINNTTIPSMSTRIDSIRTSVDNFRTNVSTQTLSCASLNGLSFTKMAIVTSTHTKIAFSKSGTFYASTELNVNLSSYGFSSIIAVFPGITRAGDYGGTPYIVSLSTTKIVYKLFRQNDEKINSRTDAFLIIGT